MCLPRIFLGLFVCLDFNIFLPPVIVSFHFSTNFWSYSHVFQCQKLDFYHGAQDGLLDMEGQRGSCAWASPQAPGTSDH